MLFVVVAVGGAGVLNSALKSLFHQPRPTLGVLDSPFEGFAFPSGHAMTATVLYSTLAMMVLERTAGVRRRLIGASAAAAVALVGMTRLALGAHYLSDVLGGIGFGLLWFAVVRSAITEDLPPSSG
jgi:membrane-associated phospholipid phosphatase